MIGEEWIASRHRRLTLSYQLYNLDGSLYDTYFLNTIFIIIRFFPQNHCVINHIYINFSVPFAECISLRDGLFSSCIYQLHCFEVIGPFDWPG